MQLWFIQPVYKRFELARICMKQRAQMLEALRADGIDAQCVVVGDDENLDVAAKLGLHTYEWHNRWVGEKLNRGYKYAKRMGADYCMPIGSDSFLHPSAFAGAPWFNASVVSLVGLSSVSADGLERLDLSVKYPAGFGVGMVYARDALGDPPCDPHRQRGLDTSTWARKRALRDGIKFMDLRPHVYINFHSDDIQITPYKSVRGSYHRKSGIDNETAIDALRPMYGDELIDELMDMYVCRSLEIFLTGKRQVPERKTSGSRLGRRQWRDRRYPKGHPQFYVGPREAMIDRFDALM